MLDHLDAYRQPRLLQLRTWRSKTVGTVAKCVHVQAGSTAIWVWNRTSNSQLAPSDTSGFSHGISCVVHSTCVKKPEIESPWRSPSSCSSPGHIHLRRSAVMKLAHPYIHYSGAYYRYSAREFWRWVCTTQEFRPSIYCILWGVQYVHAVYCKLNEGRNC